MKKRAWMSAAFGLILLLAAGGCAGKNADKQKEFEQQTKPKKQIEIEKQADTEKQTEALPEPEQPRNTESMEVINDASASPEPETQMDTEPQEAPAAQNTVPQGEESGIVYPSSNGHTVCIDAGHQAKGDSTPEPVAPGASETKARVTSGTTGRTTGVAEYQLTLQVSLKLRDELIARGYGVVMTRETNEVNLSNSERAGIAASFGADSFVRIHANGSEDSSVNGAMTICQTSGNPYVGNYYSQSKSLSQNILDAFCEATGAKKQYVWETDTMSGINWSSMPVTILEMGYMTNSTEDTNMSSENYQKKMVQGIANGIDNYYAGN
jgi:N-acetylmuramoyl-L-alanine amidase